MKDQSVKLSMFGSMQTMQRCLFWTTFRADLYYTFWASICKVASILTQKLYQYNYF